MMADPEFTLGQRLALAECGLSRAQIGALERVLPMGAAVTGDVPTMTEVSDVLGDSRKALQGAITATKELMTPTTAAQREASARVLIADENDDPAQDGEALKNAFLALAKARDVLDQALAQLPKTQRRKRTSNYLFRRIDKALLDGFGEDAGIRIEGLPSKPYIRIKPFNGGVYLKIIRIIYDAMGRQGDDTRQAIENYMAWLEGKKNIDA